MTATIVGILREGDEKRKSAENEGSGEKKEPEKALQQKYSYKT